MPINAHPDYLQAEKNYLLAQGIEEKLKCLEEMIRYVPKHKGGENLRAQLRQRYKKLKQSIEKSKKSGKSGKQGIRKAEMQAVIIGFANTGKSSLFNILTGANSEISEHGFSTSEEKLGAMDYEGAKVQMIDSPSFPNEDKSLINSADTLLLVIDSFKQIKESEKFLGNSRAKKIIIFNKIDKEENIRKIQENLKSQKINFFLFSGLNYNQEELNELKKKIFNTFPIIRVYTKEPKKEVSKEPMILKKDSTIRDAGEKILKGMSEKIKKARIWGPSSKFQGQIVGLGHVLKDKDIIELQIN